jgi:uncharacterized protein YgbK (DUF1537 family)
MLWVGSTGLSRYLPQALGLTARPSRPMPATSDGAVLIVAGSASRTTRRQLDACAAAGTIEIRLDTRPVVRGGPDREAELARVRSQLESAAASSPVLALTMTSSRADVTETKAIAATWGRTAEQASVLLVRVLGDLTENLLRGGTALKGLVVTGGHTAKTVASSLGGAAIEILDEVEPGIPLGRLTGRHDMLIVTKAGGFGSADSLAGSVERIRAHGRS